MKITILTLFPTMLEGFLEESILGRAQKSGLITIEVLNLRKWGIGKHKSVDDTPYGGGAGMVLRSDVVVSAIKDLSTKSKSQSNLETRKSKIILMTPQGKKFDQRKAEELSHNLMDDKYDLLFICGHYEGFDERIRDYVDEEMSIGDYILTGGELAAAVITDAVVRLIPGVLGKDESHQDESFSIGTQNYLEYPQYTRPEDFDGKKVPEVLKSGHHAEIEKWRRSESLKRTKSRRADLLG